MKAIGSISSYDNIILTNKGGVKWEKAIIDVQTRKPRSPNKIRRSRLFSGFAYLITTKSLLSNT